jgi:DNA-binding IclR family transcriptional regulator
MPGLIDKGLLTRRAPTQSDRGITKSAMRVCEVFELFAQRQAPLPLKEVTRSLGYPASSASALLKSLVEMGYLEYDLRQRTYFPTIRMSSMVSWVERARFGTGGILLAMQRVHAATQETVNLGTQSDLYAQYICQIASQLHVPHERIRQTVRSLDRSGTGWLILSAYGDEEVEHLLRRVQHARRGRNPPDVAAVLAQVRAIRRDGYVFSRHTVVQGAGMIGMLVPQEPGARPLTISVHAPVERLERKKRIILDELSAVMSAACALGLPQLGMV